MNILIVYAHPSKKSYTFQVLERLKSVLGNKNWHIEVSDLYASHFISDMSEAEYEREGFAKTQLPIPSDVLAEQEKIEKADAIIFLYPVWWSDCPAKLKGWFDRVYSVRYAYGQNETTRKMKTIPYGLAICTAGHPNDFLHEIEIAQSMEKIMLEDRLGKRFTHKEMIILGGTLELENVMAKHFELINKIPEKIKAIL
ncbi:NAD(P)H-dependent oxidoreductase [Flavobacterium nitrogenifigens]|uniref:NAD(P)H dehydrogenase (Quinone) n=1 Tax=Flavobacterium nitrogenifigens TaxID=1617283 RepID=A0A521DV52_9FLAO|nr:NAD(P)H-dependent oxidoreductase [Flavobacterium nitrogenifigens]KAF2327523.1 flavodoxin family protein [Flavobacterium nitrogenifigens]SMO74710.1 NAD(P)H dehydrogenase (quinone) [Flavobacterium nitrogenifigens]